MIARFRPAARLFWFLAAAAAAPRAVSIGLDGVPDAPPAFAAGLAPYLEAREAAALGFSPQGELLIATRFGDVPQLHLVEQAGGARRQLTFGSNPAKDAAFSPDPARSAFCFLRDEAGDQHWQLYYQRSGEPQAHRLTDGKGAVGAPVWSSSGHEIAFYSTARDGASHDILIVDPESGALPRLALAGDGADWRPLDWSPDDRQLLVLKTVSRAEGHLYLVDLESGQKRELDASAGKAAIKDARFARDGQGAYYLSDRDGEFLQLRFINAFSAQRTTISGHIPGDVTELAVSRDGRYLAYVSDEGGYGRLNLLDLTAHQDLTPPHLPGSGQVGALSFDAAGRRLAFSFAAPNRPRDAYVLDLASNRLEAWTRSEAGPLDEAGFSVPRRVSFPTFDRQAGKLREIPAYLYEPAGAGPHPVLILIAGGGGNEYRPEFDPWIQYVVGELKFAVVAPNVRGSSGYGRSYLALDGGSQREDAVKDIGALLVWLRSQKSFDARRVIVYGRGYGGYLALAAVVNYGDRVVGAVSAGGISDFVGLLQDASPAWAARRRADFGDERDPDVRAYLRRISPLTNVDRISQPILIEQGAHDMQVPPAAADQLVNRLRSRGIEAWYVLAGEAGDELVNKRDRDAFWRTFAQFLDKSR